LPMTKQINCWGYTGTGNGRINIVSL
jgi:hypothetical protein